VDVIQFGRGDAWWRDPGGQPMRRPSRAEQLRALVQVLDAAADAQLRADEIVAACGEGTPLPLSFARDGARLQVAYYRLSRQLDDLDLDAEWEDTRERAGALLRYHQWVLREALTVAYSPHLKGAARLRCRINGLGEPANRLRELRSFIQAEVRGEASG
jgi:hypothetical protein